MFTLVQFPTLIATQFIFKSLIRSDSDCSPSIVFFHVELPNFNWLLTQGHSHHSPRKLIQPPSTLSLQLFVLANPTTELTTLVSESGFARFKVLWKMKRD